MPVLVKAGKYKLAGAVTLYVTPYPGGMSYQLIDVERRLCYCAIIREGRVHSSSITDDNLDDPRIMRKRTEKVLMGKHLLVDEISDGSLPPTGITLIGQYPEDEQPPLSLRVLGGYRRGKQIVVIYRRSYKEQNTYCDDLGVLNPSRSVRLGLEDDAERCLSKSDWGKFRALSEGAKFRIGGVTWEKMGVEELRKLIEKKKFVIDE